MNDNNMGMNNYDDYGMEVNTSTYRAKRPNIQILGPDGKPMTPLVEQDVLNSGQIESVRTESPAVAQVMPQPNMTNEQIPAYQPSNFQSEKVNMQVMEQPAVNSMPVNTATPVENYSTVAEQEPIEKIQIEEVKPQVVEQPVDNNIPVNTVPPVENQTTQPAVNPALRGFTWAQPPTDDQGQ